MNKKSFIFNLEWAEVLKDYPAEVRLEVYDAIIRYAASGTLSELKPLAKMAFSFAKREIDYNNEKYTNTVSKRSEAGKTAMQRRWASDNKDNTCQQPITNITSDNKNNKCYHMITNVTDNEYVYDNKEISTIVDTKKGRDPDLSFVDQEYMAVFQEWLAYKRERHESYKAKSSLKAAYSKLKKLSGNNPAIAHDIIEQSMANNWAGLFELKIQHQQDIGIVLHDNSPSKYDTPANSKWEERWNR